ncbi:hypothetical protein GWI72_06185 [Microvirga tunisiensis]|uniref:Response regulatory domain-containing protein n=1 Tax=Pannonibacter tanglangensis TaxID=2750084 RepID=A0A7X5F157_9HYPH|nr:response regulator transcription factor [Pannonibacter sp. XCT-53]NBN77856.1 hypothetical protein [Pannonibacter sp. XCT-53]
MSGREWEGDSALVWQGPIWRLGGPKGASVPGWPEDVDLAAGAANANRMPAAVLLHLDDPSIRFSLAMALADMGRLRAEVPVIALTRAGRDLPDPLPRTHALIDAAVPSDSLFRMICALQRAILRTEEARLRRMIFGRVPRFGAAPHHSGGSGLLVIGLGKRFLELFDARARNVTLVGALTTDMAETYLGQRAFDAVILDTPAPEAADMIERIGRDARFARVPVLAYPDRDSDIDLLFRAGATDVLGGDLSKRQLSARLASAIRMGRRRRLADRVLAESRVWLLQEAGRGGLPIEQYDRYLAACRALCMPRGLNVSELHLKPRVDSPLLDTASLAGDMTGAILSVADATSREEDLVCAVRGLGPVAVLKGDQGGPLLQRRIAAILGQTQL